MRRILLPSLVNAKYKFFYLALFFAIISSLRIPFVPELQLLLFVTYVLKERRISNNAIFLLTTILCTHHYVIPDFVFRADGSDYPSIYTRAYGAVKLLDLLIVFIFSISLKSLYERNILKLFYINGLPSFLLITSLFGFIFLNRETFAIDNYLFISRSYLLFFAIFINTLNLSRTEYIKLSKLIIFAWSCKMFFAIIIPHPNPMYRTILGIDGIIFFAGDEYMTLPYLFVILLLLYDSRKKIEGLYKYIWIIFIMTLIAQRKGGIPIFVNLFLIFYFYSNRKRFGSILLKFYIVFFSVLQFLFLYNIDKLTTDPLLKLAFIEYSQFSHIAVDSLNHILKTNIWEFLFGISPYGKYEILNLPAELDHMTSFGSEVGEIYRYQLWSFPLGRCILNVGLIGFWMVYFYSIKAMRYSLPIFYLVLACIPLCYYTNLTPVNAFSMGIVFSFLYNISKHNISISKLK